MNMLYQVQTHPSSIKRTVINELHTSYYFKPARIYNLSNRIILFWKDIFYTDIQFLFYSYILQNLD